MEFRLLTPNFFLCENKNWEASSVVQCSSCKCEDLSSVLKTYTRKAVHVAHTIKSQLWGCGDRQIPGSCWTPSVVVALTNPKPVRDYLKNVKRYNDIQGLASLCMLICSAPTAPNPPHTHTHIMEKVSEFQCSVFCLGCNCDILLCRLVCVLTYIRALKELAIRSLSRLLELQQVAIQAIGFIFCRIFESSPQSLIVLTEKLQFPNGPPSIRGPLNSSFQIRDMMKRYKQLLAYRFVWGVDQRLRTVFVCCLVFFFYFILFCYLATC